MHFRNTLKFTFVNHLDVDDDDVNVDCETRMRESWQDKNFEKKMQKNKVKIQRIYEEWNAHAGELADV